MRSVVDEKARRGSGVVDPFTSRCATSQVADFPSDDSGDSDTLVSRGTIDAMFEGALAGIRHAHAESCYLYTHRFSCEKLTSESVGV